MNIISEFYYCNFFIAFLIRKIIPTRSFIYNKETESLLKFSDLLDFKITGIVDVPQHGLCGKKLIDVFPNALIEAMAVGLPCVSVNCKTGPAEILQNDYQQCAAQDKVYHADYGILTPVFYGGKNLDASMISQEEEIFAGELVELLLNQKLMASYRNKALYRANQFGVDAYVKEIDRLIAQELEWPEVENVGQQE